VGGFFGCEVASDAAAHRVLAGMTTSVAVAHVAAHAVSPACAWFGERDAGGARSGDDWLVVSGYVRSGRAVIDAAALLERLRARGERAIEGLSGEFALAARVRGVTFVARDHHGTRPAYFAELPSGGHAFATAIGPLIAGGVTSEVDRGGVVTSLVLGYVPAPATSLRHVRQVAPGEIVRFERRPVARRYYAPRERCDPKRSMSMAARQLDRALTQAVAMAPAAGRVGAFLSGGLDSSLVAARLHELGRTFEAYTLHFGDSLPSEIRYARAVARHLGVRHHVFELGPRAFCDAIEPALLHLEDLLSEPIAVPNYLLAREAARTCDVLFTGEGGDPLFGGPKNIGMVLEGLYGARRLGSAYMSAHHHLADDLDEALTPEWRESFDADALRQDVERRFERTRPGETFVGQLMVTNLALKGGNNILVKVAKMVGAHDLALRSPLFDRAVVDLALTIPPWQKLHGTDEKMVLKRAVARSLPAVVVHRPKRGMAVPLRAWFEGELGVYARDVLTARRVRERGIFRWKYVERLLAGQRFATDLARPRTAEKLWLVLITELHQRSLERLARPGTRKAS